MDGYGANRRKGVEIYSKFISHVNTFDISEYFYIALCLAVNLVLCVLVSRDISLPETPDVISVVLELYVAHFESSLNTYYAEHSPCLFHDNAKPVHTHGWPWPSCQPLSMVDFQPKQVSFNLDINFTIRYRSYSELIAKIINDG